MAVSKVWLGSGLVVALLIGLVSLASHQSKPQNVPNTVATGHGQPMLSTKQITVGKVNILAEVASSQTEQVSGLSGRDSLPEGTGMLFIFPEPGDLGFWMKDMLFSIDMLFADTQGKILTIAANASPDSYPQTFHPGSPAKYVLELPAGFAAAHGIAVGQRIVIGQ